MLYLNKYKERVTSVRIQNRWVVFILFLICSFGVLIGLYQYRHTKTVDLSNLEINDIKLNEKFSKKGYEVNKKLSLIVLNFITVKLTLILPLK